MAEPMKIRATMAGDTADIKVLMNHPMETGQRKDPKTGQLIPAHFISEVTATLNGKTVMEAEWSGAISKNPYLGIKVKGAKAGDKVTVTWKDNTGESNTADATVS
jgi:sulfur-oxidizing protein SoxZ